MFVLSCIQFIFYFLNEIGIFILLGLIGNNKTDENLSVMKIYSQLLTLYTFVGIIKIFLLFWVCSLCWKLKNVGTEIDIPLKKPQESEFEGYPQRQETKRKLLFFFKFKQ